MQKVIVVNQQGVMATQIVIRNNNELMRGVERAQNVTINALRISEMVAGALYKFRTDQCRPISLPRLDSISTYKQEALEKGKKMSL